MATYRRDTRNRMTPETLNEKIMTILRKRRDSGLDPATTAEALAGRLKVELPAVTASLRHLTETGRVVRDHGPQGLADQREPDRWSISH